MQERSAGDLVRRRRVFGYYVERDQWISPSAWNVHRGGHWVIGVNFGPRYVALCRDDRRRRDITIGTVSREAIVRA